MNQKRVFKVRFLSDCYDNRKWAHETWRDISLVDQKGGKVMNWKSTYPILFGARECCRALEKVKK